MNELERDIYTDLLELYARDLEIENQSMEIMNKAYEIAENMRKQMETIQPAPQPALPVFPIGPSNPYQPWPNLPNWQSPYTVTCTTITTEDGRETAYSEKYDSYYYTDTGEWTEPRCTDSECEICKDRPAKFTGE
jgi:hypothetical protein